MKPQDSRVEALQRYADGVATRDEVERLERAIVDDAEFRQLAVEYLHLDSALEEFGVEGDAEVILKPLHFARWALAAAAGIAAMGFFLWHGWLGKASSGPVQVEVLQLAAAEFANPPGGLHVHGHVPIETLELRSGEAQLRLPSEVKLSMSGPAKVRFLTPMHAQVLRGKVTVDCGTHGKGFILDTPVTRVVDLSTQFGVEAREDGKTDVMVIKGDVELHHPREAQPAAPLKEGEAVRVDATQAFARIVNITGGLQPGEWSTQPPPGDCNIVSVSDNFGSAEGYHFYRTVPHGLRPGANVYTNRPHVWQAADGEDFPVSLRDADVVQTFFGELRRPSYAIEITVARPVELFVLMPRRGIPSPWLTETFTRTGDTIFLREFESANAQHPFDVWKRVVPQAGKVTLGPSNRDANGNPMGMYGIAAKAL